MTFTLSLLRRKIRFAWTAIVVATGSLMFVSVTKPIFADNPTKPKEASTASQSTPDPKLVAIDSARKAPQPKASLPNAEDPNAIPSLITPQVASVDGAKSRIRWIKSTLDTIPSLSWQSISSSGSIAPMPTSFKEGVFLLTGVDPSGKQWLVAVNSLPWLEQFECHWKENSPGRSEETTGLKNSNAQGVTDQSTLSIVAETHNAEVERFQVTPAASNSPTSTNSAIVDEVSDSQKTTLQLVNAHDGWRFRLPAMSMTAWTWTGEYPIAGWTHLASPEGVDLMTENVTAISDVIQLMTNFRTDFGHQMDGSFESTKAGQSSAISSTWFFSMNPTVTWSNNADQSHEPGLSLQYESFNDQANGWIQTRSMPRRVKWPLAVEVWIKIDSQPNRPKVRLITTGSLGDKKWTESKQIDTPEYKDGVADSWKRYEFPTLRKNSNADSTPASTTNQGLAAPPVASPSELLQWTIEVTGAGKLWIDDVGLSPLVLTDEERRLLRSQLFVAKRELEQKRPAKAIEWIESPLVVRILQLSQECPPDFLKPVSRPIKPVAQTKRRTFLQSTSGWFWRPGKADLEPARVRIVDGMPAAPNASLKR
ncbi:MAG: hypothetical protein NTW52_02590 [Planctomycetota bacterium]|nr:hypothetical protein [Planctomycetota bacterium]